MPTMCSCTAQVCCHLRPAGPAPAELAVLPLLPAVRQVIIEGILVLHMEEIREMLNMKVGAGGWWAHRS